MSKPIASSPSNDIDSTIIKRKKHKYTFFTDIRQNKFSYLLILPAITYTVIFGYATIPFMIMAFKQFSYRLGVWRSPFNGLKNFEFFFTSDYASVVIGNTIMLNMMFLVFSTTASVLFAILLNDVISRKIAKVSQTMFLLPHFISWVIVSYILNALLATDPGVINTALRSLGLSNIRWYATASYWPAILVIMRIWKGTGYSSVIYLAVITGIDGELYEAAHIDGASRFQQNRHITLPLLMPTVAILTLLSLGRIFYGDFGMIYALIRDNGVLFPTTDVIDTYVFRLLRLVGDPAQSMAVGLFQSLIGFILVLSTNMLTRKFFPEGALF
ncbi:MAG: ABC transporter permease subunit [Oscillospiraceae bacterium]|nr:ABC transporter permease subunit [Oscillospiraceae bacterium]